MKFTLSPSLIDATRNCNKVCSAVQFIVVCIICIKVYVASPPQMYQMYLFGPPNIQVQEGNPVKKRANAELIA